MIQRLGRAGGRIVLSLAFAGFFYIAWLAVFLLLYRGAPVVLEALLWISAPVVTAAGFAAGIQVWHQITRTRRDRFLRILVWPLSGCTIGAAVVYGFGPMLIVFGMLAAGTASLIFREIKLFREV